MDTSNLKQFRILYNRLDEIVSEKTGFPEKGAFRQKLQKFFKKYPSFDSLKSEILQVHDLRNLLIHEEKYMNTIAVPTNAFLERVEQIIDLIQNPQTAKDIASANVFGCDLNDNILGIIKVMAEKVYSQVPVFENKETHEGFIGVFSESCITNLIGTQRSLVREDYCIKKEAKIKDVLDLVKEPITDAWTFVPEDLDVYKVQQMFHIISFDLKNKNRPRLGVLFVTKTGDASEKITGIITAWDLSKINQP
ncbi:hypothetical protein JW766_03175 [Candidatus Dojkabacteria bacterium]|nr:hypothetical protein [Candidatus Dojkabacteria bacterium]